MPDEVLDAVIERVRTLDFNRYPDPLANALASRLPSGTASRQLTCLVGNGGDELLYDIFVAWGGPGRSLLTFLPRSRFTRRTPCSRTRRSSTCRATRRLVHRCGSCLRASGQRAISIIVVITNPNNPTGNDDAARGRSTHPGRKATRSSSSTRRTAEFADESVAKLLGEYENLLILHTFSKAYRCAGIRLGYFLGNPNVIGEFKKVRQPYSVDAISQIVGEGGRAQPRAVRREYRADARGA